MQPLYYCLPIPMASPAHDHHLVMEGGKDEQRGLLTALYVMAEDGGTCGRAEHHERREAVDVHLKDRASVGRQDVGNVIEVDIQD